VKSPDITTLFLDIGGVLLTNGWDRFARKRAAEIYNLDYEEMNERHHLTFDTYEEGKLSIDEYLHRVVFYEKRTFSQNDFRTFMFQQSRPYPEMIELIRTVKSKNRLKVVAVSNEGRELTTHRAERFKLGEIIDLFVVSSFVHFRKPDADLYRLALDIAQVPPARVVYLEDRAMFVEVARALGIRGIQHVSHETTVAALGSLGLRLA
jgi:putative hydrolase of the HAD superfamily